MASRGINKVILVGHLGQDPDVYSGEDERLFRENVNALFPNAP